LYIIPTDGAVLPGWPLDVPYFFPGGFPPLLFPFKFFAEQPDIDRVVGLPQPQGQGLPLGLAVGRTPQARAAIVFAGVVGVNEIGSADVAGEEIGNIIVEGVGGLLGGPDGAFVHGVFVPFDETDCHGVEEFPEAACVTVAGVFGAGVGPCFFLGCVGFEDLEEVFF